MTATQVNSSIQSLGPEHSPTSPISIHDVTVAYDRKPVLWDIDYRQLATVCL
jgi:hypothetical protein